MLIFLLGVLTGVGFCVLDYLFFVLLDKLTRPAVFGNYKPPRAPKLKIVTMPKQKHYGKQLRAR
jgi:hypothetical protein